MSELVTLITCTGARPEALAICRKLILRQTYLGRMQWIIVDDSLSPNLQCESKNFIETYPGPRRWQPGLNTHRFNMELALSKVRGDHVFIIEDDDYYAPNYLEVMLDLLKHAPVVGLSNSHYYHFEIPGWLTRKNYEHASLCQTAFHKEHIPLLKKAVDSGELYFDIYFWKQVIAEKIPFILYANRPISIGMKGLPGRPGLGAGHQLKGYLHDSGHCIIKDWLGSDAQFYYPYLKGLKPVAPSSAQNITP